MLKGNTALTQKGLPLFAELNFTFQAPKKQRPITSHNNANVMIKRASKQHN
jgi:hypothetical protein